MKWLLRGDDPQRGMKAFTGLLHKDCEVDMKLLLAAGRRSARAKIKRAEALISSCMLHKRLQ